MDNVNTAIDRASRKASSSREYLNAAFCELNGALMSRDFKRCEEIRARSHTHLDDFFDALISLQAWFSAEERR